MSMSGAVSPNARDNARMKPVNIPGIAAGNTTRRIVCHLFPPKPYEASNRAWHRSDGFLARNDNDW